MRGQALRGGRRRGMCCQVGVAYGGIACVHRAAAWRALLVLVLDAMMLGVGMGVKYKKLDGAGGFA